MSGQFMYIQTVQSDTGTLNFYSFLNLIIIHQFFKQRTSIRMKNYFTDHIYSPQWQISGAGELEWLVWQSGVTGDWKKKPNLFLHTEKTQSRKYTYTSGFLFCLVVQRALLLCLRGSCSGRSCQGWTQHQIHHQESSRSQLGTILSSFSDHEPKYKNSAYNSKAKLDH